ncbi:MAG: hypothetical protein ACD_79C00090G0001, partial [uncultured bacterium]
FWALKDVSFEVNQGDRIGIIGRNGVGKSTLLKILSRITEPTTGKVTLHGRVASLLEVGTGFHPELSGRENIYLNGAILGMSKAEIKKKFDEIVDFAEIEKFLDTAVKHYSSGMYVRLAFAVAAHLESEILLVDEVLAVGDIQFQKKCLGKMEEIAIKQGRTVIFVSHNMDTINFISNKLLILHKGTIQYNGDVSQGIQLYLKNCASNMKTVDIASEKNELQRYGLRRRGQILAISTVDQYNNLKETFEFNDYFGIQMKIGLNEKINSPEVGICITNQKGHRLSHLCTKWDFPLPSMEKGTYVFWVSIDALKLYPNTYLLCCWLRTNNLEGSDDFIEGVLQFRIIQSNKFSFDFSQMTAGGLYIKSQWKYHNHA